MLIYLPWKIEFALRGSANANEFDEANPNRPAAERIANYANTAHLRDIPILPSRV